MFESFLSVRVSFQLIGAGRIPCRCAATCCDRPRFFYFLITVSSLQTSFPLKKNLTFFLTAVSNNGTMFFISARTPMKQFNKHLRGTLHCFALNKNKAYKTHCILYSRYPKSLYSNTTGKVSFIGVSIDNFVFVERHS